MWNWKQITVRVTPKPVAPATVPAQPVPSHVPVASDVS